MGVLDNLTPPSPINNCRINREKLKLSTDDAQALDAAIADPKWQTGQLAKELTNRGIPVDRFQLAIHRRGECKCSKI